MLSVGLGACGDLEGDSGGGNTSRGELTEASTTSSTTTPARDLPPRPAGVVQLDGDFNGTLASQVNRRLREDRRSRRRRGPHRGAQHRRTRPPSPTSARAPIDIAVSSRRITDAELAACADNGLQVVDFQTAYDAIVARNPERGPTSAPTASTSPSCGQMFGAGSPVTAWNQLNPNFSPLRIRPTGPEEGSVDFNYFGSRVLGAPDPTLANFRNDYRPFPRELQAKNYVAGRADAAPLQAHRQGGPDHRPSSCRPLQT